MKNQNEPITNEERDLVFDIAMGNPDVIQFIGHMRFIAQDAVEIGYMDILRWMKKNGMKGDTLLSFVVEKHERSVLNAISELRQKAYSDYKMKKIFGKRLF